MPQITLEYTQNILEKNKMNIFFKDLHDIIVEKASATLGSCKSRAIELRYFYIGNGNAENAFVHLQVLIAEGRSQKIKKSLGNSILTLLESHFFKSLEKLNLQITLEIRDLPKENYFKIPKNSI